MANLKSQKKRVITNEKARLRNASTKSAVRTQVKKAKVAITEKSDDMTKEISAAQSKLATAAAKKVIHKNAAARQISKLMKAANKAS